MGRKLRRFLEGAAALGTAALVAACLVWRAQTWAGEKGAGALLFAAGLGVEEASPSPAPEKEAEPVPTPAQDGVAPYPQISLPQVQTTPGPQPGLRPGGGDGDRRGTAGGGLHREGHHRLRHRPAGGAGSPLPGGDTGGTARWRCCCTTPTPARPTARTSPDFTTRTWPPARRTRSRAWWRWGRRSAGCWSPTALGPSTTPPSTTPCTTAPTPGPGRLCSGTWRPTPPSR